MFTVASGLDSMVVGESQILGQLRAAYAAGHRAGTVGTVLHDLAQTGAAGRQAGALRHRHRPGRCVDRLGRARPRRARVLGSLAGTPGAASSAPASMGALAGATLRRARADATSSSPTGRRSGPRLAATLGGRAVVAGAELADEIAAADLVIVLDRVRPAWSSRPTPIGARVAAARWSSSTSPCRTTSTPASATLRGVTYVDLDALRAGGATVSDDEVRGGQRDRRRGAARLPRRAAAARGRADRHRAAGPGRPGDRRRAGPARRPAARAVDAAERRRGRRRGAPGGREGAARADRAGEGAGRHARRRPVRRRAARAVRPRPGRRRVGRRRRRAGEAALGGSAADRRTGA